MASYNFTVKDALLLHDTLVFLNPHFPIRRVEFKSNNTLNIDCCWPDGSKLTKVLYKQHHRVAFEYWEAFRLRVEEYMIGQMGNQWRGK